MKKAVRKKLFLLGNLTRKEMRRAVIMKFLDEEPGPGFKYRYHVETLTGGREMSLSRPGYKKCCDFKIGVENWTGKGKHDEIRDDLLEKSQENPEDFLRLMKAIERVHACHDVEEVTDSCKNLKFKTGMGIELILKLLKWMFILEDVYYWRYDGRNKLMKFINESFSQKTIQI